MYSTLLTRVKFGVLPVPHDPGLGLGVVHHAGQLHLLVLLHLEARAREEAGQFNLGRGN